MGNKFQHKYKVHRKKLIIYFADGTDLFADYDDDEMIDNIERLQGDEPLLFVSRGEPFVYNIQPQQQVVNETDTASNILFQQIDQTDVGLVIGRKGRRMHAIRSCNGISNVFFLSEPRRTSSVSSISYK